MILQAQGLRKEFDGRAVLSQVSFHLAQGERVGLVGPNGTGKSTLLRILAGEQQADGGRLHWVTPGYRIGYLRQQELWVEQLPLAAQIGSVDQALLSRWGMDPTKLQRPAGSLSGGEKTRAALAQALSTQPELLLLDEPTNHLDVEGLDWLERVLQGYPGTLLLVSHDRYFLDRVVGRILELAEGEVKAYTGNYTAYAQQKQLERERADAEYRSYVEQKRKLEAAIRQRQEWANRAHTRKVDRTEGKVQKGIERDQARDHMRMARAMEQKLERIRVEKPREQAQLNLALDGGRGVARNLLLVEGLGHRYPGGGWLFRGANLYIQRGDRVAIVGPNGSGKSTLLRLLLGELAPVEGRVRLSPVRVAYLSQELADLNPEQSLLAEASGGNLAADQARVRTLLACLLFSGEAIRKQVRTLSGGERVRLALAKLLLTDPDLVVLDEPTNGLDLLSRERVEEALADYPGTLLFVSHDRYLLQRLARKVISIQNGRLELFLGSYEELLQRSSPQPEPSTTEERLLLETRLAQLSAALAKPNAGEEEALSAEFIAVSRRLRALKEMG